MVKNHQQTGPKTLQGKAIASANALQHGFLSRRLILPGEDPAEFQALFDGLVAEYRPGGLTETALVEKLAICLWRQRRLACGETARLALRQSRHQHKVQELARRALGINYDQTGAMVARAAGLGDAPEPDDDAEVSAVFQQAQEAMVIPDADDPLPRYQTALDNEMFKTLRALREAQSWRLDHAIISNEGSK